jgi:very-short-patch-repair endonuclease
VVPFSTSIPSGLHILDFYCASAHLAIEIDGSVHRHQAVYDRERTQWLHETHGIRVMRFYNRAICKNLPEVLAEIAEALQQ